MIHDPCYHINKCIEVIQVFMGIFFVKKKPETFGPGLSYQMEGVFLLWKVKVAKRVHTRSYWCYSRYVSVEQEHFASFKRV